MKKRLKAGAAIVNITPQRPCFLFGYPFVERMSTGVHDWLYSSSLYLSDETKQVILISNDVIYVDKDSVRRIRKEIRRRTGVSERNILIAATHTHSGPVTVDSVISENDPVVPKPDMEYVKFMEEATVKSACDAYEQAVPAKIAFLMADVTGIGTNRHNPSGAKDMEVPVLIFKNQEDEYIASMLICNMHPTVLHEDTTLFSADFPYYVRDILQKKYFGCECPVIYFTGAAGNQSPRYMTTANTFAEAERLGYIVATSIGKQLEKAKYVYDTVDINCCQHLVELPRRIFPSVELAEKQCETAKNKFERLKVMSTDMREIRSAEVDWFGAEEIVFLSRKAKNSSLDDAYGKCLPAEIQIIKLGNWRLVAWPGEIFVEYLIELKKNAENTFLITIANGELQGYIPTKEASDKGYYEAFNSFFDHTSGTIMLEKTLEELKKI